MIYNTILDAMGHTPIIRLNRMNKPGNAQVLVKFEGLNVGGSIKSRTAYNMILAAEEKGLIREDTIIVEPTSGNQGIGLALVGAVRGYKTIIIMPDSIIRDWKFWSRWRVPSTAFVRALAPAVRLPVLGRCSKHRIPI